MRRDTFDSRDRLIRRDDDVARTVTLYDAETGKPTLEREYTPAEDAEADARAGTDKPDRAPLVAQGISSLRSQITTLENRLAGVPGVEISPAVVQQVRQARALIVAATASARRSAR